MTQQQHERLKELLQAVIDTNRRLEETKQLSRNEQANVLRAQSELDKYLISVGGEAAPLKRAYVRKAKALLDSATNAAQPTNATMFNDEGRQS